MMNIFSKLTLHDILIAVTVTNTIYLFVLTACLRKTESYLESTNTALIMLARIVDINCDISSSTADVLKSLSEDTQHLQADMLTLESQIEKLTESSVISE